MTAALVQERTLCASFVSSTTFRDSSIGVLIGGKNQSYSSNLGTRRSLSRQLFGTTVPSSAARLLSSHVAVPSTGRGGSF